MLDSAGRLIGVNTAIYSPSGAYAGIGFAVEVDIVNRTVPRLIRDGRIVRSGIGAKLADDRVTQRLGIDGILLIDVEQGSPAAKAGLRPTTQYRGEIILGDIITAVSGVKVSSYEDFRTEIEKYDIGTQIVMTIVRDGSLKDVTLRLTVIN